MEKGLLQRLAGYMRDLFATGKADRPAGENPCDRVRPRLTVIEGGKGASERDSNERNKPCAVIGIPYSSDAAENTETEEKEDVMKSIAKYMFTTAAVAAAAMILAACGGGGGTGSAGGTVGTAVVSTGTMTKGSVIVNGVRFEDTAANITADDTPKTAAFLQSGMTVKVKGRRNDDGVNGTADQIEVENEVRGAISSIPGADSFVVLGQTVFVDGGTVYSDTTGLAGLDPLNTGDTVEVHGSRDSTGAIRATRVEKLNANPLGDELRGVVATKTGTTFGTFTLAGNSTTFTYDNTTSTFLPNGMFAVGDLVEVHLSGTFATRIEIEDLEDDGFDPAEGQEVEVEGFVTGLSGNDLFVNGQAVRLTGSTRYEGGVSTDLANDVKVEAEGHMVGGVLVADKITFKDSARMETNAMLGGDGVTSVTAFGKTVQIASTTDTSQATLPIAVGTGLRIRAFLNNDNVTFTATRIETLSNAVTATQQILQGTVSSINATARTLVIFGLTVNASGVPANEVQNDADQVITFDQFFGAITLNRTFVKARGSFSGSTLTANKIELE